MHVLCFGEGLHLGLTLASCFSFVGGVCVCVCVCICMVRRCTHLCFIAEFGTSQTDVRSVGSCFLSLVFHLTVSAFIGGKKSYTKV